MSVALSNERRALLCVLLFAVLALLPAICKGVPSNIDLNNHFRFALPFYESLQAGDIYPGWLAESNNGYGDTSFRFYPPGTYYLLAAARALTGQWYAASLLTFTLISIVGALGIYLWAREMMPRDQAAAAASLYAFAPYHLNQLYQAFMLAEFAGSAVLPFAFAFVERVCRRRRAADVAGLAAAYAILILTHLPLTVIGSLALFAYAVARMEKGVRLQTLARLSLGVALGLMASAVYWVTMVAELRWIVGNDPGDGSTDWHTNFLLFSFNPDYLNVWWMNILLIPMIGICAPAFALIWQKAKGKRFSGGIRATTALLFFTLFMATPLSFPLWKAFKFLQDVQFPWRWLAVTSMAGAILAAAAIPFWLAKARTKHRPLFLVITGCVLASVAFTLAHPVREAQYLSRAAFDAKLAKIPGSRSVYQWDPIWAHEPFGKMSAPVEIAGRDVAVESWQNERRVFHVTAGASTVARVRTFYYPLWTATADGHTLETSPSADGALLVRLPAEASTIQLEFREPLRTRISSLTSVVGWALIVALLFCELRRKRIQSQTFRYEF